MNYVLALGCTRDEAADVVHDTLLKAAEKGFLETSIAVSIPYLKTMVKNRFIDQKRGSRLTLLEDAEIMQMADYMPDEPVDKALLEKVGTFLNRHKYGYIIQEMEKRELKRIKDLAPYTNEKVERLYKRYQKLVKDLEEELRGYRV